MSSGLSVENLSVAYPGKAATIYDINLDIPAGSITALVGVNGAGKSTLFKAIMGFQSPESGTIRILDHSIKQALAKNLIAYVPQAEEVDWSFPVLVRDVVMMGRYGKMNFLRWPSERDRQQVEECLRRVDLWNLRDSPIDALSGGQRKRVFLARALAQEARVILLDEPFNGVDVNTENALIGLMNALRQDGCILLVSTHNLGSVPNYCDRTILIRGSVLAYGATEDVFTKDNLALAFGGTLRRFTLEGRALHRDDDHRQITVLSDDERPYVLYDEEDTPASPEDKP